MKDYYKIVWDHIHIGYSPFNKTFISMDKLYLESYSIQLRINSPIKNGNFLYNYINENLNKYKILELTYIYGESYPHTLKFNAKIVSFEVLESFGIIYYILDFNGVRIVENIQENNISKLNNYIDDELKEEFKFKRKITL